MLAAFPPRHAVRVRGYSRHMEDIERQQGWSKLPEPVRLEDIITTKPVEPGLDSTPDVDLERYWAAQEQG
ncbi:hypothetical protein GCM10023192_25860 [Amycolatopsis samaneae]